MGLAYEEFHTTVHATILVLPITVKKYSLVTDGRADPSTPLVQNPKKEKP